MRIALISPYSWTYPGGVTRHIEALAEQFLASGHEVRVLTPSDPADRRSALLHRGAEPDGRSLPEYVVPLGRTVGLRSNGSVSNLAITPNASLRLRRELRAGQFDVIHMHEPIAPVVCWDALTATDLPKVGTFHCYSTNALTNNIGNLLGARRLFNRLQLRIAVSEAAAWTGRRFFGGRYRIIPNGVAVDPALRAHDVESNQFRILFVGQVVERKGLPVLLRAFEALREHVPVSLTIIGASPDEVEPLLLDPTGICALGKVSDTEKWDQLAKADLLCAPSLGGESFGMILTEAFAAGTPVIASKIAGYSDVVTDGREGLLVPPGDATELARAMHELALDPARRVELRRAAAVTVRRYAWEQVADEVLDTYQAAIAIPAPETAPPKRLPSLEPSLPRKRSTVARIGRRIGLATASLLGVVLAAFAVHKIGIDGVAASLVASSPSWVLLGLGLMCSSMLVRAVSWHAILAAALPRDAVRLADAVQGTLIGVLMSATLPARLGEPTRALLLARRTGRPREYLPIVVGTLVSQTLINLLALALMGFVMFSSANLLAGHEQTLLVVAVTPLSLLGLILLMPVVLDREIEIRSAPIAALFDRARRGARRVRAGLGVFRSVRHGPLAVVSQLLAWVLQWLACYVLLVALGIDLKDGLAAAAAVLFAVNVTAVLPLTPSNIGVFQAACVFVLHGAYGVSEADALAYGIILQAVELATAVVMGMPALLKEGLSWKEVRLRTLHATPVRLPTKPKARPKSASAVPETSR